MRPSAGRSLPAVSSLTARTPRESIAKDLRLRWSDIYEGQGLAARADSGAPPDPPAAGAPDNERRGGLTPPPRAGCAAAGSTRGALGAAAAVGGAPATGAASPVVSFTRMALTLTCQPLNSSWSYVAVSMCIFRRAHDKCNMGHVADAAFWNVVPEKKRHSDIIVKSLFVKVAS